MEVIAHRAMGQHLHAQKRRIGVKLTSPTEKNPPKNLARQLITSHNSRFMATKYRFKIPAGYKLPAGHPLSSISAPSGAPAPPALKSWALPPYSTLILHGTTAYDTLELNEGCVIQCDPGLAAVDFSCQKLILHGQSTLDLSPRNPVPSKAPSGNPPSPFQSAPASEKDPAKGPDGTGGADGTKGYDGVHLTMSIQVLEAVDGSLWIKTDGGTGGDAGDGGPGGKGSSGPSTCFWNNDGGQGGTGGAGGTGGKGGATAGVSLKLGPNTIHGKDSADLAPTPPPALAYGQIEIVGRRGRGGARGVGGPGGPGGEGQEAPGGIFCPSTDSNSGPPGDKGQDGREGDKGDFTP